MSFAYFLTPEYLKENSPIDENVDENLLKTAMKDAQELYIKDLIGSGLYDALCTQIDAATVTAANATLLQTYIAPCLVNYIMYESAEMVSYQFLNKGISTRNSDNSNTADINQITTLMNRWKDKAEAYGNKLQAFLFANPSDYPLFLNSNSSIDSVSPSSGQYFGGVFFENNQCDERKLSDKP